MEKSQKYVSIIMKIVLTSCTLRKTLRAISLITDGLRSSWSWSGKGSCHLLCFEKFREKAFKISAMLKKKWGDLIWNPWPWNNFLKFLSFESKGKHLKVTVLTFLTLANRNVPFMEPCQPNYPKVNSFPLQSFLNYNFN